ncbi:MAG TPA: PDZ domain-containing protein [Mycobacteriales bacterium]|nr:PDZ domain-containing protein [Mycobacteriales bacterium]
MSRRVVTMITGAVLLLALAVGGSQLPVPYAELGPGPTLDTLGVDQGGNEIIRLTGHPESKTKGHLNLTTVSVRDQLDLLEALRGWLDRDRAVVPREEIFPPGQTEQQTNEKNTRDFVASQDSAELAALAYLHLTKVVVSSVESGSPSYQKLAPKDTITAVQGRKVGDVAGLGAVLRETNPGTTVRVDYDRAGRAGTTEITTVSGKDDSGRTRAVLGVTVAMQSTAPFKVKIGLDDRIGGPSAGLMFALGILEKVGPEDLTGGRFIAGTGQIDTYGVVNPIGGIPLKLIAARSKGATVFLVPAGNCAEAVRGPPAGLQLVKVDSLSSAVDALDAIKAGRPAPACTAG